MIQKYSRYIILQKFFDSPTKPFYIRELARKTKISQPSVTIHIKELVKENLILKKIEGIYPTFKANRDNETFRLYKKNYTVLTIKNSGLLNYLYDSLSPNSIILFGSASKGEDIEESDIDLFVESSEKRLNLNKYEEILKRKINVIFKKSFNDISTKELKNNVINGEILRGYLKVF